MRNLAKSLALSGCLCLSALPAQAIVNCPTGTPPVSGAATPQGDSKANQAARTLAGLLPPGETTPPAYARFAPAANEGWQAYSRSYFQPLSAWASKEVRQDPGATVFYPFSGPDLPTVVALFPSAARVVLISDQYAQPYADPLSLKDSDQARIADELAEAWASFGQRGFFVTQELNKRGGSDGRLHLTPSMILLAFAARLGYEVRSIRPVCFEASDLSIRLAEGNAAWSSVRLELQKDGRQLVVDYLQQDLSNRGLTKRSGNRGLIESLSRGPVLIKAASHLPQQPAFTHLRDALLRHAPLIVQDETGIEYDVLANDFKVRLHGEYVSAHRLFREYTNRSLAKAYKDQAQEVRPLSFKFGYEKAAGSAIQVATRK